MTDPAVADAPAGQTGSLTARVASGLRWSLLTTVVVRLTSLGVSVALARMLGASEFGVYAVALVALTAILSLNELGVSVALVRYEGDDRPVAPTVMTLSAAGSLLCFAAVWVAAPALAEAFHAPGALWPVRVMAAGVVVDGLVATPAALLQRHFLQARRAAADMTNFFAGAVVSLALAAAGAGAMSLAWGRIAGSAGSAVLLLRLAPYPLRFGWDRARARALLAVGLPLAAASLLSFGVLNVDYVVVGRSLGPVMLGVYLLAFNLSSWPVTVLSQPVRKVSVAAFAELLGDRDRLRRAVLTSTGLLASITVPVAATLGASAFPLVRLVYGSAWLASAPVLAWLAALGAARVLLELWYDVLVALGLGRRLMAVTALWLVTLAGGLPLGVHLGSVTGAAVAHCVIAVGLMVPLHLGLVAHQLHLRPLPLLRVWAGPLAAGAVVVAPSLAVQWLVDRNGWGGWGDLASLVTAGAVGGAVSLRALLRLRRTALAPEDEAA